MNIRYIVLLAILLVQVAGGDEQNSTSITYRTDVDQDYGFYRVIDITTHKPAPYENNTLIINVGDTVMWINDATPDEPLTIISEGLWNNTSAKLRWNYQKFSYTFNKSGTYKVYIREYPRNYQTIVVNSTIQIPITTVISTPMASNVSIDVAPNTPIATTIAITTTNKIQNLSIIWLFIIVIGIIVFIIYRTKNRK